MNSSIPSLSASSDRTPEDSGTEVASNPDTRSKVPNSGNEGRVIDAVEIDPETNRVKLPSKSEGRSELSDDSLLGGPEKALEGMRSISFGWVMFDALGAIMKSSGGLGGRMIALAGGVDGVGDISVGVGSSVNAGVERSDSGVGVGMLKI
jgi:hypothetical protein